MREQREVKRKADGSFDVVVTRTIRDAAEILRLRDRLRSDVDATRNLLAQLEAQLADLEAAAAQLPG